MSAPKPPSGLARYAGHSNTQEIWGGLIGEKIAAVFETNGYAMHEEGTILWLVMESGVAFCHRTPNGAFWVASKADVDREVYHQRAALRNTVRKLGHLGTVAILAPEETP
jgi:hypothetical protein